MMSSRKVKMQMKIPAGCAIASMRESPMISARSARQRGMSLVELMIAMLLGLIVLLAVTQIFVGNRQTFAITEASSEVQESGRIALQLLSRAVRNADYWGCLENAAAADNILNVSTVPGDPYGFERGVTALRASETDENIQPGRAVLTLAGINSSRSASLSDEQTSSTSTFLQAADGVNFSNIFQAGEILVASNCEFADIFQADAVTAQRITIDQTSSFSPGVRTGSLRNSVSNYRNGRVLPLAGERYFVRQQSDGRSALMFQPLNTRGGNSGSFVNPQELVSGIEEMAIQLGIDSNGNGTIDRWEDLRDASAANAASHADDALGLRISLLVSSRTDQVMSAPMGFCFPAWGDCGDDGSDLRLADDRRLYRVYSSSIGIRNRLSD
ncbi:MAG: prepilin-type N-terminal cleavage/methylation domain-containing protein [Halomonadaceae bacterium]|nr:MAG: prepilin-type N-terminal cleavage/methylation domain-containing protein [Halomonadaceae bacterium]